MTNAFGTGPMRHRHKNKQPMPYLHHRRYELTNQDLNQLLIGIVYPIKSNGMFTDWNLIRTSATATLPPFFRPPAMFDRGYYLYHNQMPILKFFKHAKDLKEYVDNRYINTTDSAPDFYVFAVSS